MQTQIDSRAAKLPLVLGGHSFIEQLGNDPAIGPEEAVALVSHCLDRGIAWFDTTYMPERVALGAALADLDRRDEATILAWNFFQEFGPGENVGEPAAYGDADLDRLCEELKTDHVDLLVVHPVEDPLEQRRQEELASSWVASGRVAELGAWAPPLDLFGRFEDVPYSWVIAPFNPFTRRAHEVFEAARALGAKTMATSPFGRGWDLERLAAASGVPMRSAVAQISDLMLRFSLFDSGVDRLVVSMRRLEWVTANAASVAKGPLSPREHRRLADLLRISQS
jgi:aryl-alcohol dehydrogenase-like predicted oxidoreductase